MFRFCYVKFMLRYITCYVVMLYNLLSYAMLYNMLCCVIFILRYRTYNVYVMLYNMLCCVLSRYFVTLYNMLCYVCYITCYFML